MRRVGEPRHLRNRVQLRIRVGQQTARDHDSDAAGGVTRYAYGSTIALADADGNVATEYSYEPAGAGNVAAGGPRLMLEASAY